MEITKQISIQKINNLIEAQKKHPWDVGKAIWQLVHQKKFANQTTYTDDLDYFLQNVSFGLTECWYWIGSIDQNGYGIWSFRKKTKAHRSVFQTFKNEIPKKKLVLHHCDSRNCVNPDHLYIGDQFQNIRDMISRKRNFIPNPLKGDRNPMAKLSREKINFAENLRSTGMSYKKIATQMGFSTMTIFRALTKRSWK